MDKKFAIVTELPRTEVTLMQLKRAHHRYLFSKEFVYGKKVLEIGCGGGVGVNIITDFAESYLGIDIDENNLLLCRKNYQNNEKATFQQSDAENISFPKNSFDVIIMFEVIYYIHDFEKLLLRLKNMLSESGILIISTSNCSWTDFNPSAFSTKYYTVPELNQIMNKYFNYIEFYAAFPEIINSIKKKILSYLKRLAVKFRLIPKSMKWKLVLKKLFIGEIIKYPDILTEDLFQYDPPAKIDPEKTDSHHTVIYAICKNNLS